MKSLNVLFLVAISLFGCVHYTNLTKAQLEERGTRRYANVTREQVTEASAIALETLGYRVTLKQPETGVVKTQPKTILVSATGSRTYAQATEDQLAWAVNIEPSGSDVVLHALPRGFRNGTEQKEDGIWVAEMIDTKFRDLLNEITSTLVVKSPSQMQTR